MYCIIQTTERSLYVSSKCAKKCFAFSPSSMANYKPFDLCLSSLAFFCKNHSSQEETEGNRELSKAQKNDREQGKKSGHSIKAIFGGNILSVDGSIPTPPENRYSSLYSIYRQTAQPSSSYQTDFPGCPDYVHCYTRWALLYIGRDGGRIFAKLACLANVLPAVF